MNILQKHRTKIVRGIGTIVLIASAYFIAGGIFGLASGSMVKDDDGYYTTWKRGIDRDSSAVVFKPDGKWIAAGMEHVKFRVESDDELFIGIADTADVAAYLDGVSHDEVISLPMFPPMTNYLNVSGGLPPANPEAQDFWVATNTTSGVKELRWKLSDRTTFIIMNADGSRGIDAVIHILTIETFNAFLGISNLGIGGFLLLLGLIIVLSTRTHRYGAYPVPMGMLPKK